MHEIAFLTSKTQTYLIFFKTSKQDPLALSSQRLTCLVAIYDEIGLNNNLFCLVVIFCHKPGVHVWKLKWTPPRQLESWHQKAMPNATASYIIALPPWYRVYQNIYIPLLPTMAMIYILLYMIRHISDLIIYYWTSISLYMWGFTTYSIEI